MATFNVEKRTGTGKYTAFEMRKQGRIPGVIYGKTLKDNINVSLALKEFMILLKAGERILDLNVDGQVMHVLIKAVQHGTYDHEILHADFRAISENETIEVVLNIELQGEADAPGIREGGVLDRSLHQVVARCKPKDLPEKIVLDISGINLDDILYVTDLPKLPGVEYMAHGNPAVVGCHAPIAVEEPAAGEEGAVVPEVIGEKEREAKAKE